MFDLTLSAVHNITHLVQPEEFHELSPCSSALEIFTDFKRYRPITIDGSTPAEEVEMLMRKAHVKMTLVVDADNEFIGTISLDDLSEQRFITLVANGFDRRDILVHELMVPRAHIMALTLHDLEQSSISDVIRALQRSGQQHCLVVDSDGHCIRGVISASDVARRLHIPIHIERIPTFVDIFSSIRRPAA